jgi:hypothetical protein
LFSLPILYAFLLCLSQCVCCENFTLVQGSLLNVFALKFP